MAYAVHITIVNILMMNRNLHEMYINFLAYNFCQKLIIEINLLIKPMYTEARMFLQHITEYRISNEEKDTLVAAAANELKNILAKLS